MPLSKSCLADIVRLNLWIPPGYISSTLTVAFSWKNGVAQADPLRKLTRWWLMKCCSSNESSTNSTGTLIYTKWLCKQNRSRVQVQIWEHFIFVSPNATKGHHVISLPERWWTPTSSALVTEMYLTRFGREINYPMYFKTNHGSTCKITQNRTIN